MRLWLGAVLFSLATPLAFATGEQGGGHSSGGGGAFACFVPTTNWTLSPEVQLHTVPLLMAPVTRVRSLDLTLAERDYPGRALLAMAPLESEEQFLKRSLDTLEAAAPEVAQALTQVFARMEFQFSSGYTATFPQILDHGYVGPLAPPAQGSEACFTVTMAAQDLLADGRIRVTWNDPLQFDPHHPRISRGAVALHELSYAWFRDHGARDSADAKRFTAAFLAQDWARVRELAPR